VIAETLIRDIRFAARSLARSRRFTIIAVAILALGLGAAGLAFSLVRGVLLEPLPYDRPDELYQVIVRHTGGGRAYEETTVETVVLDVWREAARGVAGAVASNEARRETVFYLSGEGEPQRVPGAFVSSDFFEVLGARPLLGSASPEAVAGGDGAERAVISFDLWQTMFGGDRAAIGRAIDVNGRIVEIAGVMASDFVMPPPVGATIGPEPVAAWVIGIRNEGPTARYDRVFVRVATSVSPAAAADELSGLARGAAVGPPITGIRLEPIRELVVGGVRSGLVMMSVIVGFTLLMTCVSIGAVQLARFSGRARELAVRAALGAGRVRVFTHLLAEGLLLSLAGSAGGLLLVLAGRDTLLAIAPADLPRTAGTGVNAAVIAFMLAASVITGLASTVLPAAVTVATATRHDSLRSRASTGTRSAHRARAALVVVQVVIAVALIAGAGALARSVAHLFAANTGMIDGDAVVFDIHRRLDRSGAVDHARFYDDVIDRVRDLPGVTSAALASSVPFRPRDYYTSDWRSRVITGQYFRTLGVTLLTGREFDRRDNASSPRVAIINRALAGKVFGGADPVGATLDGMTVVGVAPDIRHENLAEDAQPAMYVPFAQQSDARMSVLVRSDARAAATIEAVREVVRRIDPAQPVPGARTVAGILARSDAVRRRTFLLRVLAVVGVFAGLLAALGVHGVAAQSVVERTTEVGVRVSLGATRAQVTRLVLGDALRLVAAGLMGGALLSIALVRGLSSSLYGIGAVDPVGLIGSAMTLGVIAVIACVIPARRAAGIEPMAALRRDSSS